MAPNRKIHVNLKRSFGSYATHLHPELLISDLDITSENQTKISNESHFKDGKSGCQAVSTWY